MAYKRRLCDLTRAHLIPEFTYKRAPDKLSGSQAKERVPISIASPGSEKKKTRAHSRDSFSHPEDVFIAEEAQNEQKEGNSSR